MEFLNFGMAKGELLHKTSALVNFVIGLDRELVQHWTVFANQALRQTEVCIPLK
jgi:hypothetical protein